MPRHRPHLLALLALSALAVAACGKSRPRAGAPTPATTVIIPGGGPGGGSGGGGGTGGDVGVTVEACTKCHGDPARVAVATDAAGIEIAPPRDAAGLTTGGAAIGAHQAHLHGTRLRSRGVDCASCHVVPATASTHPSQKVQLRGLAAVSWAGAPAISPTATASGCAATYCHGNFPGGRGQPGGPNATMSWTGTTADAACGSCHGDPPAFQRDGATPHSSSTTCSGCHGAGYAITGITGAALATHLDGLFQAPAGAHAIPYPASQHGPAALNPATGGLATCEGCHANFDSPVGLATSSCNACHAGVTGSGPTWLQNCTFCHGGNGGNTTGAPPRDTHALAGTAQPTSLVTVGAHLSHVANTGATATAHAIAAPLDCAACHPQKWTTADPALAPGHVDAATATVNGPLGYSRPTTTTGSCASAACHGAGPTISAAAKGSATSPIWTTVDGTQATCNSCHQSPPPLSAASPHPQNATCASCHGAGYALGGMSGGALATHVDGTLQAPALGCTACHGSLAGLGGAAVASGDPSAAPGYAAGSVDTTGATTGAAVGAHAAHLTKTDFRSAPIACAECHAVPASGTTAHATGAGTGGARATLTWGSLATGTPSSVPVTPSFTGSTTASGGTTAGSCASTWCHGNIPNGNNVTMSWTGAASTASCGSCHGLPPAGTHPVLATGRLCSDCHAGTTGAVGGAPGTFAVNPATHLDGIIEAVGHAIPFPAYQHGPAALNPATGGLATCAACHVAFGSANPSGPTPSSSDCTVCHTANVTGAGPTWLQNCTFCHGGNGGNTTGAPPRDTHAVAGTVQPTTLVTVGAHVSHVANTGAATTAHVIAAPLDCAACHPQKWTTADPALAPGHVDAATATVNAPLGYSRPTATTGSCASAACHGPGVVSAAALGGASAPVWTTVDGTQATCGSCHQSPPPLSAASPHPRNAACATCHGAGYSLAGLSGGALATHVDGTVEKPASGCTACHGSLAGLSGAAVANTDPSAAPGYVATAVDATGSTTGAAVGAHAAHLTKTDFRSAPIACAECHAVPATGDTSHATGTGTGGARATLTWGGLATGAPSGVPVTPSFTGSTTASGGTTAGSCASTWCHGNIPNGNNVTMSWTGAASTASCGSCHGLPPAGTHPALTAGTACSGCHTGYAGTVGGAPGTFAVNTALHLNGVVDASGHPAGWKEPNQHGLAALNQVLVAGQPQGGAGFAGCTICHTGFGPVGSAGSISSCNSCHATPAAVGGTYTTGTYPNHANWQTECTFCHGGRDNTTGAPPRTTLVISSDTTTPQLTTDNRIGAHTSHVGTGGTTTRHAIAGSLACTACHQTMWTSATDVGHVDKTSADVFFNAVGATPNPGSYTSGTGCAANYCHGNFTGGAGAAPAWTGTFGATFTLTCASCHGAPPGPISATVKHPQSTSCGDCHANYTATTVAAATHVDGTVQKPSGCTACHGELNPAVAAQPVASGSSFAAPGYGATPTSKDSHGNTATTARGVGVHAAHLTGGSGRSRAVLCAECHAVPAAGDTTHVTGTAAVAFSGVATSNGAVAAAWNGAGGAPTLTCSSTYCHGNFAGGASATPTWNVAGQLSCTACHGDPPTAAQGHPQNTNCAACHGAGYSTTTVAAATHVDGVVTLTGAESCTSCHGTAGRAGVTGADGNQAAAPPIDTTGATSASIARVGAHLAHVNGARAPALSSPIGCAVCHPVPTLNRHANGTTQVTFTGLAVTGGITTASYASPSCSATYCHGNFAGGAGTAAAPVWNLNPAAQLGCTSCHGNPPAQSTGHPQNDACGTCHGAGYSKTGATTGTVVAATHVNGTVDLVAAESCTSCHGTAGRAGVAGADGNQAAAPPIDTTGGTLASTARVGAHLAHVNGARAPALSSPISCAACHPVPAVNRHANGTTQVTFSGLSVTGGITSASYASPTCSATYCHGNFTGGNGTAAAPAWNASPGAQLACTSCHQAPPPANASSHHPPNPNCVVCHGANYSTTTVNAATHVNGTVEHAPATGCTQCHGDVTVSGVANTDVRAAPGGDASAIDAHGNAATATTARGVGAHAKHLTGTTWRSAPIACAECHAVPATGDVAHANGNPLLTFGTLASTAWAGKPAITPTWNGAGGAASTTCSSVYCHGAFPGGLNPSPSWTSPGSVACGSCHGIPPAFQSDGVTAHTTSTACGSCHGGAYTSTTVDPTLHMNGKIDGGGESTGGTSCGGCHTTTFNGMNGVTTGKISKHTVGTDSPLDGAFSWTGTDLTSSVTVANRSCVTMCHGDHPHDLTSPVTATHENNLYFDATTQTTRADGSASRVGAGGTGTQNRAKTDFDSTQNAGACASCHQKPVAAGGLTVSAATFGASAHDFTANTVGANSYAWTYPIHDGSVFLRNCTKCHASRAEGNTPAATTTVAVHYSDTDPHLLAGTTNPAGSAANFVCYNCHGSAASPAAGAQGNRSGKDIQSQIAHATTAGQSGHPANTDAVHNSATEFNNAAFGNTLGVTGRHANCLDCHEPHQAQPTSGNVRVVGSATNGNVAGPALQGAWGAKFGGTLAAFAAPTSANFTKTTIAAGTEPEATLCFKCHSAYYGTLPASPSGGFTETDQAREFNPANVSFHPVLGSSSAKLGNTGNVLAPWTRTSLMTCTDCHESDVTTDPNGPHGSAAKFILKGPNTTWNATLQPATGGTMPAGTFCANCHAASFSGSRFPHTNGFHEGSQQGAPVYCMSCHIAIPHGSGHVGMLVSVSTGGTPAGGVQVTDSAPYAVNPRLGIFSYPATNTTAWGNSNCGCDSVSNGH